MRSAVRICPFLPFSLSFPDASGYRLPHGLERFSYLLVASLSMLSLKLKERVQKVIKVLERLRSADHDSFADLAG